jgi:hypothetical protein
MSQTALEFFNTHHVAGSVCLIGANDAIGRLVRAGQAAMTPNGQPSLWSHSFLMGERRGDGRTDGSLYMFESDLQVSVKNWEVQNGAMESRPAKWCGDPTEHACVLGMNLSAAESGQVVTKALEGCDRPHPHVSRETLPEPALHFSPRMAQVSPWQTP